MGTEAPASSPKSTSGLAIASLVLGLLSCLIIPAPIALVLGIMALVRINKDPKLKGNGLAITGIVLAGTLAIISLLAAIAIPSFLSFKGRSKQSECKTNLKMLYTAQKSYFQEKDTYGSDFTSIVFVPERGTRYAYAMEPNETFVTLGELKEGVTALLADKDTASQSILREVTSMPLAGGAELGIVGECPSSCTFTGMCMGNLDDDAQFDVWSISTRDRTASDGTVIPGGQPHQEIDDLRR